jgi:D-alanyl-lipoteichoic acid acyltransferase DltB (MBOAT superfamily)
VFKYADFFRGTVYGVLGDDWQPWSLILPLGISFFVFQKISYLIDLKRGDRHIYGFLDFCMFVMFFPQLIAGPLVRHNEIIDQFRLDPRRPAMWENLSRGFFLFLIGVAKKVAIADTVAHIADPLFHKAATGVLSAAEAWVATGAYTLQIYFDFSGYSDMAIGLALMFGLCLPLNFNAPYRSLSVRDFWRRWHMTLSRFLRDYLYFPLGGNRHGNVRRYTNLMVTMLLGGLWHGAGWTFVVWGGLHGIYLCVNHAWQHLRQRLGLRGGTRMSHLLAGATTFAAVVVGWVFFRAQDFPTALSILAGMAGAHGVTLPDAFAYRLPAVAAILKQVGVAFAPGGGTTFVSTYAWIGVLLPVVFLWPNTQEIMSRFRPALGAALTAIPRWQQWSPRGGWATIAGIVAAAGLLSLTRHSEFLYFQF